MDPRSHLPIIQTPADPTHFQAPANLTPPSASAEIISTQIPAEHMDPQAAADFINHHALTATQTHIEAATPTLPLSQLHEQQRLAPSEQPAISTPGHGVITGFSGLFCDH